MTPLTLYDLISEDMIVIAKHINEHTVTIQVLNENGDLVFNEISDVSAWRSLVDIAKQVINIDHFMAWKL